MTKTNTEAVEARVPRAWKSHDGEKCPVAPEGPVEIITRGGIQSFWPKAGAVVWEYGTFVPELGTSLPKSAEVVFYCRSALSPTAKTEPSAAGLEGWRKLPHLPKGEALYGAHDYLQDPEGLERFRSLAVEQSGHKMAPININSLRRLLDTISRLKQALSAPTREREESKAIERAAKYDELIYAVGNKYPGETRHETALRYIRQAEEPKGGPGDALLKDQASE